MLGVDPNDEVRETIINYVEEGCPDVDQSAYDITQLAKPIGDMPMGMLDGSTAVDGEFQPAIPKQKPPLQEISYIRRDVPPVTQIQMGVKAHRPQNADVGDFINSKLREIDNDPVQPPYDSLQEYAYEGEGSMYGSSLSSLNEAPVELDQDDEMDAQRFTTLRNDKQQPVESSNLDSDLEQIKTWGPKFNKISNIYGIKLDTTDT